MEKQRSTWFITRDFAHVLSESRAFGTAEASTIQYRYTTFGELQQFTDARGQVTAYVYDDRGLRLYYSGFGEVRQAVRYATSFTASDATTTADLDTTFGAETAAPPARRLSRASNMKSAAL